MPRPGRAAGAGLAEVPGGAGPGLADTLTRREREIATFACRGWSSAAIAGELGVWEAPSRATSTGPAPGSAITSRAELAIALAG